MIEGINDGHFCTEGNHRTARKKYGLIKNYFKYNVQYTTLQNKTNSNIKKF